ncbi:MAG TPA: LacI family DNA-binding transcriptional regulator [Sphaerochaeta sp.]|nr:LacI family DNA-binding transcriptional regulator [Sphaerochaeta sp.]
MTIEEIAKLAGVSTGTVDRVLHNRGRVSPVTRERVLAIIKEQNFKPNAFARNLKLNKEFRIGVLLPLLHSEYGYWNLIYQGIINAAKELSDLSVKIDVYEFDRQKGGSCFEAGRRMLKNPVDAFILAPVCPDDAKLVLAAHPDIDCIFIDTSMPQPHRASSVTQNPYKAGYLAGRMMNLLSPNPGTYAVALTHRAAYNASERARGFKEFCARQEGMRTKTVELNFEGNWEKILEDLYVTTTDIQGVFVVNDSVHRVASHINLIGHRPKTTIIGFDLIVQNRKEMENGIIDCLISQRPEFQGYSAVYQLYRKGILNQQLEKETEIPIDIILPENLSSTESMDYIPRIRS